MGATTPRKLPPTAEIPDLGQVPDAEIARRYGVSRELIRQRRVAVGIPALPQAGAAARRYEEIRTAARGCATFTEAARKAGCSRATVKKAGVVGRGVGTPGHGDDGPTARIHRALALAGGVGLDFAACLVVAYRDELSRPRTADSSVAKALQRLVETRRATRTGTHGRHRWHPSSSTTRHQDVP